MPCLTDLFNEPLDAALKLAAELGASHQGSEIQQIDLLVQELIGDVTLGDLHGKPLGDGRLAHTGFADEAGVVLLPAVQDLDDPLDLLVPADHAVQLTAPGAVGQVDAVVVKELLFAVLRLFRTAALGRAGGVFLPGRIGGILIVCPEQAVQKRECGSLTLVLLAVILPFLRVLGDQTLQPLGILEHIHHLVGQVVQILIGDAHALHHIVHGLHTHLSGALQAQALILGHAVFDPADKDDGQIFLAFRAECWLHSGKLPSGKNSILQ